MVKHSFTIAIPSTNTNIAFLPAQPFLLSAALDSVFFSFSLSNSSQLDEK
jgi:hypothetical protein